MLAGRPGPGDRRLLRDRDRDDPGARARRSPRRRTRPASREGRGGLAARGTPSRWTNSTSATSTASPLRRTVPGVGPALDLLIDNAGIMACPETRVGPGLGGAVRHQPPRPLRARQPAVAGDRPAAALGWCRCPRAATAARGCAGTTSQSSTATTSGRPTGRPRRPTCCSPCISTRSAARAGVRAFPCTRAGSSPRCSATCPREEMVALGWIDEDGNPVGAAGSRPRSRAPRRGCGRRPRRGSTASGGVYCEDCDIAVASEGRLPRRVAEWATDPRAGGPALAGAVGRADGAGPASPSDHPC